MALTDTAIRALKPKEKRYIVTDGKKEGLYLEIFPTGGKVWRYRYRLNGKREKVTLGKYPGLGLKAARMRYDDLLTEVNDGKSPAEERREKRKAKAGKVNASMTVKKFGGVYYNDVIRKDRSKPEFLLRYLENDIYPAIGDKRMSEVTTDDCRSIVWAKKDHGFDAAAGQIRQLLKRMFEYAGSRCGVTANPVLELDMKHIHKARERDRFLSAAEIGEFLQCVYASNMRRQFKLAFHLLLITLVRKGELMGAKWDNIDLKKGEWLIPASDTKQSRDHMVYLSHQAVEIFHELKRLAGGSEYVLPGRGSLVQPFAQNALNKALREAMTQSEVPYFTIHDLRRTGSTHLNEAGFNSDWIEKALGHEQRGVRSVYNRAEYADQRREMLQEWTSFVDSQIENGRKLILGNFGGQQRAS